MVKKLTLFIAVITLLMAFSDFPPAGKEMVDNVNRYVLGSPHEKLYLHTDKSVYTVGEKIWFRGYLVNAVSHTPRVLSNYIYADLVDRRDSLISRVKVVQRDTCFYGHVELPLNLAQGDYCLRGYSYYMQNLGQDFLFNKKIRVINPKDSRVKTDVSYQYDKNGITASLHLEDAGGEPFDRTVLTYFTNQSRDRRYGKNTRTDRSGNTDIKLDADVKFYDISFADGVPFDFKRYLFVPKQLNEFDVQFFPEGGELLSGNWQWVAFKAIGTDGMGLEVSGELLQDSVVIGEFVSEHDGMGRFRLPVSPGYQYQARIRLASGEEKIFQLPQPSSTGIGLSVEIEEDYLTYRILKGDKADFPQDLYVFVHTRGIMLGVEQVNRLFRGKIKLETIPEGIAHIVLVDKEGVVYSQRLFFVRHEDGPELIVKSNKRQYLPREKVELEIGVDGKQDWGDLTLSLTVTDDTKVLVDTLEDNILSNILLTSDLKGYINHPAYYFNPNNPKRDEYLDLVMMTHGWTRFDFSKLVKGEYEPNKFALELGQIIAGRVDNFWGKKSKGAQIILLSDRGLFHMAETDEDGGFLIDGIHFPDSSKFVVQALNAKGRRSVSVYIDQDEFLPPLNPLPYTIEVKEKEDDFFDRFGQDYYYENGEKIYILNEVMVVKRKVVKTHSIYDRMARHYIDSLTLQDYNQFDIINMIQQVVPGVMLERDEEGNEYFAAFGRKLYMVVNDFEEDIDFLRLIDSKAVLGISYLDQTQGFMFFGQQAANGALVISYDIAYAPPKLPRPNIKPFSILGYQKPEAFYVPKYDVDSVRRDSRYDTRSTIYWNPVVNIKSGERISLDFFTADTPGEYTVIVEGMTSGGIVCRKKTKLTLK